jgi:uncharacterized Tic20 family protein
MFSHLGGLLALTHIPFANIIGPLICYLKIRDESEYAREHARNSLNFQITLGIFLLAVVFVALFWWIGTIGAMATMSHDSAGPPVAFLGGIFAFVLVFLAAGITNLICCILGAIAASSGRMFRYPLAIPFVK